jgi:hypothetical protein
MYTGEGDNEGSNTDSKHSGDADASDSGKGGISAAPLHATSKRVFSNAHAYHINSLATNSDGQTFVSADDLRINWWDLETSDTCFSKYMWFVMMVFCVVCSYENTEKWRYCNILCAL